MRHSEKRFDGSIVSVDKIYDDTRGTLAAESVPFVGDSPEYWNGYLYDSYGRLEYSQSELRESETTYVYDGSSTTTIDDDGTAVTRTYDLFGNLVSVTDSAGTVTYSLAPDGQPMTVVAPGNATTTFGYDSYRRRTSMDDPSLGTTLYKYDEAGNTVEVTDANGITTRHAYDRYGRLTRTENPEMATDYSYDTDGNLTSVVTDNGTSKSFTYDVYGRIATSTESIVDGKWLRKDYTYANGNISSIKYTSQSGELATENYIYAHGHLVEVRLNNTTPIFRLEAENVYGQPTRIITGGITSKYGYTAWGWPAEREAGSEAKTYQRFSYKFNPKTLLLESRFDSLSNIYETFGYDPLHRLVSVKSEILPELHRPTPGDSLIVIGPIDRFKPLSADLSGSITIPGQQYPVEQYNTNRQQVSYDTNGNITNKSDAGKYEYALPARPYAVSGLTSPGKGIAKRDRYVSYASFSRPELIEEDGNIAIFTYNGDCDRVKMQLSRNYTIILTRYYLGGCYEIDETPAGVKEKLYLYGNYYDAVAAYVKEPSRAGVYNILRDYLGSITQVVDPQGNLVQDIRYDAWGRTHGTITVRPFAPGSEPELFLGRGYTGHEHLPCFGLVNMNARLYDPALGRFLSPDPYVQMPDMSQNFNRYSYALNNPLCYVDESGEFVLSTFLTTGVGIFLENVFWGAIIGAGTSAITYTVSTLVTGQSWNNSDFWKSIGVGAVSGAIGGGFGGLQSSLSFGNSFGYNTLSGIANMVSTNVIFGHDISFYDIYSIAGMAALGSALPTFQGVDGSRFMNGISEIGHNAVRGMATGSVAGILDAYIYDDLNRIWQNTFGGAVSGISRTLAMDIIFGTPYKVDKSYGVEGLYRSGGISALLNIGQGMTLGKNMYVKHNDNVEDTRYHENYHIQQQNSEGWARFYGRTALQYLRYGNDVYFTPKTFENDARVNTNKYIEKPKM